MLEPRRGETYPWPFHGHATTGLSFALLLVLPDDFISLQGTRVLEDREVRSSYCYITEGAPRLQASQSVIKYTGTDNAPEWMDSEQGQCIRFNTFARDLSQADNFETLCSIQADLRTAPCQKKLGKKGRMCYTRIFDVVMLVGLTELKAQIAWTDSATVSTQEILPFSPHF